MRRMIANCFCAKSKFKRYIKEKKNYVFGPLQAPLEVEAAVGFARNLNTLFK